MKVWLLILLPLPMLVAAYLIDWPFSVSLAFLDGILLGYYLGMSYALERLHAARYGTLPSSALVDSAINRLLFGKQPLE